VTVRFDVRYAIEVRRKHFCVFKWMPMVGFYFCVGVFDNYDRRAVVLIGKRFHELFRVAW